MKDKKKVIEYIILGLILFCCQYFFTDMMGDEIWNYSFAKNIAEGMIPYKDFHMLQTPLFAFIEAIFLKILGNNLATFHLVNTFIVLFIYKQYRDYNKNAALLCFSVFIAFLVPSYTVMTLLFLALILKEERKNKKEKDNTYIGFLLALCFFTKQNVGVVLSIVGFLSCIILKEKKEFIDRMKGFILATIPFFIYFLVTKSLYDFFDHTILGLLEFTNNRLITPAIIMEGIILLYIIYELINNKKERRIFFYYLAFQIISVPLIDGYHVIVATLPVFIQIFSKGKINTKVVYGLSIYCILITFVFHGIRLKENNFIYDHDLKFAKYKLMDEVSANGIKNVANFIKGNKNEVIIIDECAILFRIAAEEKITKFDFLLDGNMGYNGSSKMLNKIKNKCDKEKCTFLMVKDENLWNKPTNQVNKKFYYYVKDNFEEKESLEYLTIYE